MPQTAESYDLESLYKQILQKKTVSDEHLDALSRAIQYEKSHREGELSGSERDVVVRLLVERRKIRSIFSKRQKAADKVTHSYYRVPTNTNMEIYIDPKLMNTDDSATVLSEEQMKVLDFLHYLESAEYLEDIERANEYRPAFFKEIDPNNLPTFFIHSEESGVSADIGSPGSSGFKLNGVSYPNGSIIAESNKSYRSIFMHEMIHNYEPLHRDQEECLLYNEGLVRMTDIRAVNGNPHENLVEIYKEYAEKHSWNSENFPQKDIMTITRDSFECDLEKIFSPDMQFDRAKESAKVNHGPPETIAKCIVRYELGASFLDWVSRVKKMPLSKRIYSDPRNHFVTNEPNYKVIADAVVNLTYNSPWEEDQSENLSYLEFLNATLCRFALREDDPSVALGAKRIEEAIDTLEGDARKERITEILKNLYHLAKNAFEEVQDEYNAYMTGVVKSIRN